VDNLEQMQLWGIPTDLAVVYTTLARVLGAQGDVTGALGVLDQAEQAKQRYAVLPEFGSLVDTYRVQIWLASGSLPEAVSWAASVSAQDVQPGTDESEALLIREAIEITLARVLVAEGRALANGSPIDRALDLLTRLAARTESGGRGGRLIEILVLQAMAYSVQGDVSRALAALGKSLRLAEPQGYARVYLDEGQAIADLLRSGTARQRWGEPHLTDYANRLLQAHDDGTPDPSPTTAVQGASTVDSPSPLIEPLTPRERQVLHLIGAGCSNQEIAQELVITLSTVKKHTGNIYGKLGVSSRTQALSRAHQLGLISRGS